MAHIKSAKKRIKLSQQAALRNRAVRSKTKTSIRRFYEAMEAKEPEQAAARLKAAISTVDRAAGKGVIHRNAAARRKSRLMRAYNELVAGGRPE